MINWLAQGLLDSAGFVASCFITRDTPQFVVMQGAVAIVLLVSIVAVLAFWPGPFRSTLPPRHFQRLNPLHRFRYFDLSRG